MKLKRENIGQRVQLKRDYMFGFQAGDVGTIAGADAEHYTVHFDTPRNGWSRKSLGIPDLCGLYVNSENLRKVKEISQ